MSVRGESQYLFVVSPNVHSRGEPKSAHDEPQCPLVASLPVLSLPKGRTMNGHAKTL